MKTPKFPIGTVFKSTGKNGKVITITDIYFTYNSQNELVKYSYVGQHTFMGQVLTDYDIPETSILRGTLIN